MINASCSCFNPSHYTGTHNDHVNPGKGQPVAGVPLTLGPFQTAVGIVSTQCGASRHKLAFVKRLLFGNIERGTQGRGLSRGL